ncbi:MAG: KEOPS complex subunit Cgi121 [Candidatus Methanomethylophilaceae archaeon]
MDRKVTVIGAKGTCGLDRIVEHFTSKGGDVIVMDPLYVYCPEQVISAAEHAERAFREGRNRSRTFLTETMMYVSGERQVSKALEKMRPPEGSDGFVLSLFDIDDPDLEALGLTECPSLLEGTPEKAEAMGLDASGMDIDLRDLALETVAMLDIEKV